MATRPSLPNFGPTNCDTMNKAVKIAETLPIRSALTWALIEGWDHFDLDLYDKILIAKQNNGIHNFTPHAKAKLRADRGKRSL